jgi:hypothetical protein
MLGLEFLNGAGKGGNPFTWTLRSGPSSRRVRREPRVAKETDVYGSARKEIAIHDRIYSASKPKEKT